MFKRDHHLRIATILQTMNPEVLQKHQCYFGGGTAIVLLRDEYRESIDIDLMVSSLESYRELRSEIRVKNDLSYILREGTELQLSRGIRAEKDAIRTMINVGSVEVKFEIIFEARIDFETPPPTSRLCGIATLTPLDLAASKLLANSDRWADDAIYSRDIIDLAMIGLNKEKMEVAKEKARTAYGKSVDADLKKAITNLKNRKGHLLRCMEILKMSPPPTAAELWEKIKHL